ncbi:MAG: glutathione S-transferase [Verrucomicrobia bacterium]|nr:glutathione S-transferase [Verrucomicrobiota bacterium]
MIELIQFPWSPFCLVQRRILEFAGAPFKIVNVSSGDRSLVWKVTRQRYYQVPVLKDGKTVVFETDEDSQVIAKYLDNRLQLGLFPAEWAGVQRILWRYIESEVQDCTFKLNDIYWQENVPQSERLTYLRHKERKFGRGCFEQWRAQQDQMLEALAKSLIPFEQMLADKNFLLDARPRFVDFDLFGMLANLLYSGHYELPAAHTQLKLWHTRMAKAKHLKINA